MSFRNKNFEEEKLRVNDSHQVPPFVIGGEMNSREVTVANEEALKKICSVIVSIHEGFLSKCQNIEIYRNLSQEEQNLLNIIEKNTTLHTTLAGVLAVDSCVKCIDKEQQFLMGNVFRAMSNITGQFQELAFKIKQDNSVFQQMVENLADAIKYLLQSMFCLPVAKDRQNELETQLNLLENIEFKEGLSWSLQKKSELLSDIQKENQILKMAIKEKDQYIKTLQRGNKYEKLEEKRTSHTLAFRPFTERSSENGSNEIHEELIKLKEELTQKNTIILKMNEEFASQMQKYNSVFKRLQEENKVLKKYADIETSELLQELQAEIDMLRDEKRKDQMIINDIQRKIEGISCRRSRMTPYNQHEMCSYLEPTYAPPYDPQPIHVSYGMQRQHQRFYSPNYNPSHLTRYSKTQNYPEDLRAVYGGHPITQTLPQRARNAIRSSRLSKNQNSRSRSRVNHAFQLAESRQTLQSKPASSFNLYERIKSKKY